MTAGRSDLTELDLQLHQETDKAILVSDDGNRENAVWLPRSQIEIERGPRGGISVTLPEWLAIDKELV